MKKIVTFMYNFIVFFMILILAYVLFCSFFSIHYGDSIKYNLSPIILILGCFVFGSFIRKLSAKLLPLLNCKYENKIFYIILISLFLILFFFSENFIVLPIYDLVQVQREALHLLYSNFPIFENVEYFSRYPNNTFLVLIFYWIYKLAALLKLYNINMINNLFSSFMLVLTVWGSYRISQQWTKNNNEKIWTLLFLFFSPIFLLYAPYPYTDSISMPFGIWCVYLFAKGYEEKNIKKRIFFFILAGMLGIIGGKIRATVLILVIAIFCVIICKLKWKLFMQWGISLVIGLGILTIAWTGIVKHYNVPQDKNKQFPAMHFIMMGFNPDTGGLYNEEDYKFTNNLQTAEEKNDKTFSKAKERLLDMGVKGGIKHLQNKLKINWSNGVTVQKTWNNSYQYNNAYDYTIGNKGIFFQYFCQIGRCLVLFFALLTMLKILINKEIDFWVIAIFGGFLFYMMWEVKPRYSFSFIPWLTILASKSANDVYYFNAFFIQNDSQNKKIKIEFSDAFYYKLKQVLLIFTCLIILINYDFYTKKMDLYHDPVIISSRTDRKIPLLGVCEQTFVASRNFNNVKFKFDNSNCNKDLDYIMQLYNDQTEVLLYEETFSSSNVKNNKWYTFNLPQVIVKQKELYKIRFIPKNGDSNDYLSVNASNHLDYIPSGELFLEGNSQNSDLTMELTNRIKRPYTSKRFYILLSTLILCIELYSFNKINLSKLKKV